MKQINESIKTKTKHTHTHTTVMLGYGVPPYIRSHTHSAMLRPVPALQAQVSAVDWRRHLGAGAQHVVGADGRVAAVHGERAVGGRGRDGVAGRRRVLRQVDHGLRAGHVAVEAGGVAGVRLALLPLKQLPHGVVAHGAPLVGRRRAQRLLVERRRQAADAVALRHAVAGDAAVAIAVLGHVGHPVAGQVPGQRLVGGDAGEAERETHTERERISH